MRCWRLLPRSCANGSVASRNRARCSVRPRCSSGNDDECRVEAVVAAARAALVSRRGGSSVLKGSKRGLDRKVQPISIHGQISLDVYFTDPGEPEGQVSVARIGPESVPRNLEAGETV